MGRALIAARQAFWIGRFVLKGGAETRAVWLQGWGRGLCHWGEPLGLARSAWGPGAAKKKNLRFTTQHEVRNV